MGVASILHTFGGRQLYVIARDDAGRQAAISSQVLRKVAAQLLVDLVGRRFDRFKAKTPSHPAVKKGAGQSAHARARIKQAAGLQGAGWEQGRHEAGHTRGCHELAKLGLALLRNARCHLAAHAVCGV